MGTFLKSRKSISKLLVVILSGVMIISLSGCGGTGTTSNSTSNSSSAAGKDFVFGAMLPLTGPSATLGKSMINGAELAIDATNSKGGAGGLSLKMQLEDNPGTPQIAVTALQKLVNVYHVPFSLTGFSGATVALAPIADKNHVVLINGGASTSSLRGVGKYVFTDLSLADTQVKAMLDYAYNELKIRKLALIYGNEEQGQAFLKQIEDTWPKMGGTLVAKVAVSPTASDFNTQVTKLQESNPDGVYLGFFGSGQGNVLKAASEKGFQTKWIGSSSVNNAAALKIAGQAAVGVYDVEQPLDMSNPMAKSFADAYKKKYGSNPDTFASNYYTAVQVLAQIVTELQKEKKPLTGENILDKMLTDKFDTVFGPVTFNEDGTTLVGIGIGRYSGSNFDIARKYTPEEIKKLK